MYLKTRLIFSHFYQEPLYTLILTQLTTRRDGRGLGMEATEPDHNSSLENKNMLNQCVVRSTVEVASSLVLYQTRNM